MKQLLVLLFVVLLAGCIRPASKQRWNFDGATEVILELNSRWSDSSKFKKELSINDPVKMKQLFNELNEAKDLGPLKCAPSRWERLVIFRGDAMWKFRTNGEVLEADDSTAFYELKNNIFKEYFYIGTN